jgi:hypothetical protein
MKKFEDQRKQDEERCKREAAAMAKRLWKPEQQLRKASDADAETIY